MPDHAGLPPPASAGRPWGITNWLIVSHLIRLPNQTGTLLLVFPALWGLVLASQGRPPFLLLILFIAGAFLMRSAGVVLNDFADRSFDRQVARTRTRPLASGAISVPEALLIAILLLALAGALVLLLNRLTLLLSPVALLLAIVYPFSKRIVPLPQAALGLAFGWGAVMAWAAVRNSLDAPVWLLYASVIAWAVTYDTIYALQDREDDARIGIKSAAILFGARTWMAVGIAFATMLVLLGITGWLVAIGPLFYVVLLGVAAFAVYQVFRLQGPVSPDLALMLFRQHVWVGWAILAGLWLGFL
jgi:4-hydroxybenzoate polyprenyltransferase